MAELSTWSWTFGTPLALGLSLLLLPLLWMGRRKLRAFSPRQRRLALLARGLLFGLLVLALADPRLGRPDERLAVVFALDVSASIQPPQQSLQAEWLRLALAARRPDDRVEAIAFGRRAVPLDPSAGGALPPDDATNLDDALRLAANLLPSEGARRVVLITDGQQNLGRAEERAAQLAGRGIQISYAPPEPAIFPLDVVARSLEVTSYARDGEAIEAEVLVESTHRTFASVRLRTDGQPTAEQELNLERGLNRVRFYLRPRGLGFHAFRAEVVALDDTIPRNNAVDGFTIVKENGRILVLEQRPGEASELVEALTETGLRVDVNPPSFVPPSAAGLRLYDSVVLMNVPATALSLDQQTTLQQFVYDGGKGLVVMGGNTSYALGAYGGTPLADALPVDPAPPLRREQGNVALVLAIDKSGSMDLYRADTSKMAMAREAAILALDSLTPGDQVAVLAFDTRNTWVVQPTRITGPGDVRAIQQRIAGIRADGGTDIYPALDAAFSAAASMQSKLRHIVLLTDGQSWEGDYAGLIARMKPHSITLTTIGIGSDTDQNLLTRLARMGDGRYYFTERPQEVPKIVTRETTIVSRNALVEGRIQPQVTEPSPLLTGLGGAELPQLGGYIATTPRPRAQTVLTSDRGDPLLAHWQYGLGRVVAWTSDGRSDWAAGWFARPETRRVWGQALRWSMPSPVDPAFQLTTSVQDDQVTLRVSAAEPDGRFAQGLQVRADVVTPERQGLQLPLRQVGPGTYEVTVQASAPGAYAVEALDLRGGVPLRSELAGFVVESGRELRTLGANRALLEQLAQASGGRMIDDPRDAFTRDAKLAGLRWEPLWPWLLGAALLLLPLDVAVRRLSLFRGRRR